MQETSLSEYFNMDRRINAHQTARKLQKRIKIALLGSFTLNGFKETLNVKCHDIGIGASFYISGYNQYANELVNENSKFYKFKPDMTFLLVDVASLFGELYFDPYNSSKKKRMEAVRYNYRKLEGLIKNFTKYGSGILVMNNFAVPTYSPMGILETKQDYGFLHMTRDLNARISGFNRYRPLFIFDYDSFASKIGKKNITDDTLLYLADMKISPDLIPHLCEEYMRYIRASKGMTRKCIVLDLDNTLWGGIIGEDGLEGIKLGPSAPGNAYMEFQKSILALFHRGVILAVNSNNNRNDVMEVFKKHPYMILKEGHFASLKINWESKIKNLIDIAKDINIGLDSMIYLDDDKRNRQIVMEALPQVLCPDLPEDVSYYTRFLMDIKDIDALQITHEDKKRGRLYTTERKRKESISTFSNLSRYLEHLNIVTELNRADKFSVPRLSQLTLRTNQFNFSTKRYDENQMARLIKDKRYDVYYVRVKDKYGDYGITGTVIIEKEKNNWLIDTFLLSCRILGRDIEEAVLTNIVKRAAKANGQKVEIYHKKTEKNKPVYRFLDKLTREYGIRQTRPILGGMITTLWQRGENQKFNKYPKHIRVISE